jgi:thiol-disulfide isomerase/thioredoxin
MILKVFTQPNCPKCPSAKELCANLKSQNSNLKIEYYDVSEANGLAEASFYSLMATPSFVLLDDFGKEIQTWRGETPTLKELTTLLRLV